MQAIHYISDFKFFSGRNTGGKYSSVVEALRAHLKYIGRDEKGVFKFNFDISSWLKRAREEIGKRWDSRVALKFVMALPYSVDENNVEEWISYVSDFIGKNLNVPKENITICAHLHKSKAGFYNPHLHIVVFPRDRKGKKLRITKKDLSEFHRKWQEFLKKQGFKVVKLPEEERIPHIGLRLNYDKEAQEFYKTYLRIRELERELNHRRRGEEREEKREEKRARELEIGLLEKGLAFLGGIMGNFRENQYNEVVKHLKELGYSDDDKVVVFLSNHDGEVYQKVFDVKKLKDKKMLSFLAYKNAKGFSVYMSVNTLKPNAKTRKKEDFKEKQRRIYLDLDSKEVSAGKLVHRLYYILRKYGLPNPTRIIRTSKGNYQVFWLLDREVDYRLLEEVMKKLNYELEIDKTQDVSRVFRLPAFFNRKKGKGELVKSLKHLIVKQAGKEIGKIIATGKPASADSFLKLIEEPTLPAPKDKDDEIREQTRKKIAEIRKKLEQRRITATNWQTSVLKVAENKVKQFSKAEYRKLYKELFRNEDSEIRKLSQIALNRNVGKSPSEVELALLGLIYAKYDGNPPDEVLQKVLEKIYTLAKARGKYNPNDYVRRTLEKVEEFWRKNSTKQENPHQDNGNLSEKLKNQRKRLKIHHSRRKI